MRRGNYALLFALSLVVLLGIGAIVLDLGNARFTRVQARNVAEAIAHDGALVLDGTDDGLSDATTVSAETAGGNIVSGDSVSTDGSSDSDAQVDLGSWDSDSATFTVTGVAEDVNAVRATVTVADSGTWFSQGAWGREALPVQASAIAVRERRGAGSVECFLPFAVASCLLEDAYGVDGIQDIDLVLNPAGIDNAGWASPVGEPSASWLSDQIEDCNNTGSVSVGDSINLGNGEDTSVMHTLTDVLEDSDTVWDPDVWGTQPEQLPNSGIDAAYYGNTVEGPIFVFENDEYCVSGGGWTETTVIAAFVWAAVYDVTQIGVGAGNRTYRLRIDTTRDHDDGTSSGGTDYGVYTDAVAVVR